LDEGEGMSGASFDSRAPRAAQDEEGRVLHQHC
jgi:hypothetical protein